LAINAAVPIAHYGGVVALVERATDERPDELKGVLRNVVPFEQVLPQVR
jgi:hypothetical protein